MLLFPSLAPSFGKEHLCSFTLNLLIFLLMLESGGIHVHSKRWSKAKFIPCACPKCKLLMQSGSPQINEYNKYNCCTNLQSYQQCGSSPLSSFLSSLLASSLFSTQGTISIGLFTTNSFIWKLKYSSISLVIFFDFQYYTFQFLAFENLSSLLLILCSYDI